MSAAQPAPSGGESTDIVDEASAAAQGTRTAARWIASALGGVPSLAILSAIVRAPGDAGFDVVRLALGVGLCAAGALVAVLGFARVISPVPLEDEDLRDLDLKRIPGQPYRTFAELDRDMDEIRTAALEEEYKNNQPGAWSEQLARRERIRARAYRLKAADEVGRRYRQAQLATVLAVGLIATGIVLLALAPKPKPPAVKSAALPATAAACSEARLMVRLTYGPL